MKLFSFVWCHNHEHLPTIHTGRRLDNCEVLAGRVYAKALLLPDVAVRKLATTEPDGHLDLVALFEKAARVPDLGVEVVVVGFRTDLDFFDLNLNLIFPSSSFALLTLVLHLPVITNLTNRRTGVWGHFDQVEATLFRERNTVRCHELSELVAFIVDHQHAGRADGSVDSKLVFIRFLLDPAAGPSSQTASLSPSSSVYEKVG